MAEIVDLSGKRIETEQEPEPRTFVVTTLPDKDGFMKSWEVTGYAGIVPPVVVVGSADGRMECIVPIANLHNVTVKDEAA